MHTQWQAAHLKDCWHRLQHIVVVPDAVVRCLLQVSQKTSNQQMAFGRDSSMWVTATLSVSKKQKQKSFVSSDKQGL